MFIFGTFTILFFFGTLNAGCKIVFITKTFALPYKYVESDNNNENNEIILRIIQ